MIEIFFQGLVAFDNLPPQLRYINLRGNKDLFGVLDESVLTNPILQVQIQGTGIQVKRKPCGLGYDLLTGHPDSDDW